MIHNLTVLSTLKLYQHHIKSPASICSAGESFGIKFLGNPPITSPALQYNNCHKPSKTTRSYSTSINTFKWPSEHGKLSTHCHGYFNMVSELGFQKHKTSLCYYFINCLKFLLILHFIHIIVIVASDSYFWIDSSLHHTSHHLLACMGEHSNWQFAPRSNALCPTSTYTYEISIRLDNLSTHYLFILINHF